MKYLTIGIANRIKYVRDIMTKTMVYYIFMSCIYKYLQNNP